MPDPYLSIVMPAYNEALRIGRALEQVRRYLESKAFVSEFVVVDDGSLDGTPELLRQATQRFPEMRALTNKFNQGKGYSVRRGALDARGQLILFTDVDLSAPIEDGDKLLAALEAKQADVAVGSRALRRELIGIHQPLFRELSGRLFNLLVRLITGLHVHDTQCGFKLFRRATTRRAFELQRSTGFGFDPEVLFLIQRLGGKIVEVPVRWNDDPATKVRFLKDSAAMALDLVRLRWRAWTGQYSLD